MKSYDILPGSKPRQTRSDKWKKRPCVMRYRAFADEVRLNGIDIPSSGAHITFILPMPKSWSNKKKNSMDGTPHTQRPDIDNLLKSILDALFKEDSHIWDIRASKLWGETGKIVIIKG